MARMFAIAMLVVCLWSADFAWNCFPKEARAEEVNRVIKVAPQDQSVLVESSAGLLRVVHIGDSLAPYGQIQSIDQTRIVFKNAEAETVIMSFANGEQKLQRINKTIPSSHLSLPQTVTVGEGGGDAGEMDEGVGKAGSEVKD